MSPKGKRILRHAAWYLLIRWDIRRPFELHRREVGEAFDLLMRLAH